MATSSSSCYTSPFTTASSTKHQTTTQLPSTITCFTRRSPISISLRSTSRPLVVTAATNAVEVEKSTVTKTPSKILPFRVGHGFDLHRLEPGYPLIIGGINIPHDRGCEAHSDGNLYWFSLLLLQSMIRYSILMFVQNRLYRNCMLLNWLYLFRLCVSVLVFVCWNMCWLRKMRLHKSKLCRISLF